MLVIRRNARLNGLSCPPSREPNIGILPGSHVTQVDVGRVDDVGVFGGMPYQRVRGVVHGQLAGDEPIVGLHAHATPYAYESELEVPPVPVVFAKWASALVGPDEDIVVPHEETRPDFEGEVAVVSIPGLFW